jgi:hypothetical protein
MRLLSLQRVDDRAPFLGHCLPQVNGVDEDVPHVFVFYGIRMHADDAGSLQGTQQDSSDGSLQERAGEESHREG